METKLENLFVRRYFFHQSAQSTIVNITFLKKEGSIDVNTKA